MEKQQGSQDSARPYTLGKRRTVADGNRAKVLSAARDLILENGIPDLTMDAVARRCGLTRQTVHNQFGSKSGLMEAMCDNLAALGRLEDLAVVFQEPDPLLALERHIAIFARFWSVDRVLTRRVRGLQAIDPELEKVLRERMQRRRGGLATLVDRLVQAFGPPVHLTNQNVADVLYSLTTFDFFDSLAGERNTPEEVAPLVIQIVKSWLAGVFPIPSAPANRRRLNYVPSRIVNKLRITP